MEASVSWETLVPLYQTTQFYISEDYNIHIRHFENLKSHSNITKFGLSPSTMMKCKWSSCDQCTVSVAIILVWCDGGYRSALQPYWKCWLCLFSVLLCNQRVTFAASSLNCYHFMMFTTSYRHFMLLKIRKYLQSHHFILVMFSTLSLNKLLQEISVIVKLIFLHNCKKCKWWLVW